MSATEAVRRNSQGGINLGLSMGVNIGGTYGYTRATVAANQNNANSNVRPSQQSNLSPRAQAGSHIHNGPGESSTNRAASNAVRTVQQHQREINVHFQEGEAEEEDCEDDEEEYESYEEEREQEDEEEVEDENDLECYLRNVNIDTSRLRARTAPLRPMEHVE